MLKNILSRVGTGVIKTIGAIKEPIRRLGQVGYQVGKFAVQNHATLAPLIHGVAQMSGNKTAQQITGGLLALSQSASLRKNLNADNQRIATAMAKGQSGVWDHSKGGFR